MKRNQENRRRWSINTADLNMQQHSNYLKQALPKDAGMGYSNFFKLGQDLNYIETNYKPEKDLSLLSQIDNAEPRIVVSLGIKGRSRFVANKGDEVFFNEGYTTITSFNSCLGERQYEAGEDLLQLRFSLSKEYLSRYFGENESAAFFKKEGVYNLSYQPITPQGLLSVQQLLENNSPRETQDIFMHGQALSLLASELSPLFNSDKAKLEKYNQLDKEIAKTARDILYTEYKTPPSVELLSKRAGTNQLKLKKLFHHFFNTTPYGLLLEIRMNIAYQLLESSQCHVSIAADHVGYRHASNFSAAFVKFFGISPKLVSRKYQNK